MMMMMMMMMKMTMSFSLAPPPSTLACLDASGHMAMIVVVMSTIALTRAARAGMEEEKDRRKGAAERGEEETKGEKAYEAGAGARGWNEWAGLIFVQARNVPG